MSYSITVDVEARQVTINGKRYTFASLRDKKNKTSLEEEISEACTALSKEKPLLFADEELDELYVEHNKTRV